MKTMQSVGLRSISLILEFINLGEEEYTSINQVTKDTAKKMIKVLNEYQNKSKQIPEELSEYAKWR